MSKYTLAVFDAETDPFLYGRIPFPFAWGFYDGNKFVHFWGDNCTEKFVSFLKSLKKKYIMLAHNGGRFDAMFLLQYIDTGTIKIINGRIAEFKLFGHIVRDSLLILPMPLKDYKKDEIDYDKFERENREKNKSEIVEYLSDDCLFLFDLVFAFYNKFGRKLTVGSAAINELKKFHPFERIGESHDKIFRQFYYGGRVECFKTGIIKGDFKLYDVNSLYPDRMKNAIHPCGENYTLFTGINARFNPVNFDLCDYPDIPYFINFVGYNYGALPQQIKGIMDFNIPYGEFFCTSHEFKVAMEFGKIKPEFVKFVYVPEKTINFAEFVDHFYSERLKAKASGDKIADILNKFIMNSASGKFGTNPDNFFDYRIGDIDDSDFLDSCEDDYFTLYSRDENIALFRRKSFIGNNSYLDVAIVASITGAGRAKLLRAICESNNPIMCDTDSLLCEKLAAKIDPKILGAWKLEHKVDTAYIAAKKLYVLTSKTKPILKPNEKEPEKINGQWVLKIASKGVRVKGKDIVDLIKSGEHTWFNDAPTFSLKRTPNNFSAENDKHFIHRDLKFKVK
jgi:hypothetical protein